MPKMPDDGCLFSGEGVLEPSNLTIAPSKFAEMCCLGGSGVSSVSPFAGEDWFSGPEEKSVSIMRL